MDPLWQSFKSHPFQEGLPSLGEICFQINKYKLHVVQSLEKPTPFLQSQNQKYSIMSLSLFISPSL